MNNPPPPARILVLDHNPDSAELLSRSLRRKFPRAAILQTSDLEDASVTVRSLQIDAAVVHRPVGGDTVGAVKALREADPKLPIIVVSGVDRSEESFTAGAIGFLHMDQWMLIGNVIENAIESHPR